MIEVKDLCFAYGEKQIIRDFSLDVKTGELVALMGASGSGKTTLLRLFAGLEKPQSGEIRIGTDKTVVAFQEPRLFPWLTVEQNMDAVLPPKIEKTDRQKAIAEALAFVGLTGSEGQKPAELSGGMRSRASLARALAYGKLTGAELYLLDEPFSALDEAKRDELSAALRELMRERGATAVLVTHNTSDAERFADRLIRIDDLSKLSADI